MELNKSLQQLLQRYYYSVRYFRISKRTEHIIRKLYKEQFSRFFFSFFSNQKKIIDVCIEASSQR